MAASPYLMLIHNDIIVKRDIVQYFFDNIDNAIAIGQIGQARPFCAYLPGHDLGVAWFRDVNQLGFRAKHADLSLYLDHNPGHKALFYKKLYMDREARAANLIRRVFPEKIPFLKERGFFPD